MVSFLTPFESDMLCIQSFERQRHQQTPSVLIRYHPSFQIWSEYIPP